MKYRISARIEDQVVVFVGCTKSAIPEGALLLQTTEERPLYHWVKWSLRFRRTLRDRKALDHPYVKYFKNSLRTKRLLGNKEFDRLSAKENAAFLRYNQRKPYILEDFLEAAFKEKSQGRHLFSASSLISQSRWGKSRTERGTDPYKISDRWVPWYSRLAQMLEPHLVGFFEVRPSIADGLVWVDDRTWQQFAAENQDRIKWTENADEIPDSDWEYLE